MLQLQTLLEDELSCTHHEMLLSEFQEFLSKSHCDENLLFIKATNRFIGGQGEYSLAEWAEVYHRFIEQDSPKECNFPESIRTEFDLAYAKKVLPSEEAIEQARFHVINLLQDAYTKFQRNSSASPFMYCGECDCHEHDKPAALERQAADADADADADLMSPMLSKFNEFALEEEDEDEVEEEVEGGEDLEERSEKASSREGARAASTPPSLRPQTPPVIYESPSQSESGTYSESQEGLQQQMPYSPFSPPTAPATAGTAPNQRLKKLHRYSVSSSSKGSTASSSSSVSSQSPNVNPSQKFSKLVHRLKFGRSSSSSGGQSGPQSWQ